MPNPSIMLNKTQEKDGRCHEALASTWPVWEFPAAIVEMRKRLFRTNGLLPIFDTRHIEKRQSSIIENHQKFDNSLYCQSMQKGYIIYNTGRQPSTSGGLKWILISMSISQPDPTGR